MKGKINNKTKKYHKQFDEVFIIFIYTKHGIR